MTDAERAAEQQRDRDREQARLRLEEEAKKNPGQRLVPEFGSDRGLPSAASAQPAQGQAGHGQQDADRARRREEGKLIQAGPRGPASLGSPARSRSPL